MEAAKDMNERKNLVWALGAVALVILVGLFVLVLGKPADSPAEAPKAFLPATSGGDPMQRGNELYAGGQYAAAVQEYQRALSADAGNVSARVNLGNAYFALDKLDDAAREFTEASKQAPNDADIHSNLAAVLLRQGKMNEALERVKKAVELRPDLAEGHYILGVIYRQTGQTTLALNEFRQAITLTTDARLKTEAEQQVSALTK